MTGGGFTAVGETLTATGADAAEPDVTSSGTTGAPGSWILTIGNLGAGRVCSLAPGVHSISVGGGPVLTERSRHGMSATRTRPALAVR